MSLKLRLSRAGTKKRPYYHVVVADARYRLPDGSEGVMRAAFEIGRAEGGSPAPLRADRPSGMTDALAALLDGEVERV